VSGSTPTVSVILRSHNNRAYLSESISTILGQEGASWELIIVDDGSDDGAGEIAAEAARSDTRVRTLFQPRSGAPSAANNGILSARGTYIAIQDSDDRSLPERLAQQADFLSANPDCAAVTCYAREIDSSGQIIPNSATEAWFNTPRDFSDPHTWLGENHFFNPGAMVRRTAYAEWGLYDPALLQKHDLEFWLRVVCGGGKLSAIPRIMVEYRRHGSNLTGSDHVSERLKLAFIFTKHVQPWLAKVGRLDLMEQLYDALIGDDPDVPAELVRQLAHLQLRPPSPTTDFASWTRGVQDLDIPEPRLLAWLIRSLKDARAWGQGMAAEKDKLAADRAWLTERKAEFFHERENARAHLHELTSELAETRRTLHEILNSRVWRMTWPVRALGTRLKQASRPPAVAAAAPEPRSTPHAACRPGSRPGLLVILPWFQVGGAEIVMHSVIDGLKQDWDISIVTTIADDNAMHRQFAEVTGAIYHLPQIMPPEHYESFIVDTLAQNNIETVLVSGSQIGYRALARIRREAPDVRLVDLLHNASEHGHFRTSVACDSSIDRHICVSERIAAALHKDGVAQAKTRVIYNGIDTQTLFNPAGHEPARAKAGLGLPKESFVVGYVGRLSEEKRPDIFLDIAEALEKADSARFLVCGHGPLEPAFEQRLLRSSVRDRIVWLRGATPAEIPGIFAAMNVKVLPSAIEGFPLTALEALAMGVPVVSTNAGDVEAVVATGVNGHVVPVDRPLDAVPVLRRLIDEPASYASLRAKTRNSVHGTRFARPAMIESYRALLSELRR